VDIDEVENMLMLNLLSVGLPKQREKKLKLEVMVILKLAA
jgi:hypothetical protein